MHEFLAALPHFIMYPKPQLVTRAVHTFSVRRVLGSNVASRSVALKRFASNVASRSVVLIRTVPAQIYIIILLQLEWW
jgi:hypothetical protein